MSDEVRKKAIANFVVWKSESSFSSQATAIRPAGLVRTRSLYNSHGQSGRWQFHRNCCQFFLKNKKGKSTPVRQLLPFYIQQYNQTIIFPDMPGSSKPFFPFSRSYLPGNLSYRHHRYPLLSRVVRCPYGFHELTYHCPDSG